MYIFEKERKYRTKVSDREGNKDYSQEYFDDAKARRMQAAKSWRGTRRLSQDELWQIGKIDGAEFYYSGPQDSYEPYYVIHAYSGEGNHDNVLVTFDLDFCFADIIEDEGIDDPDEAERIRLEIIKDYEYFLKQKGFGRMIDWITDADPALNFDDAYVDVDSMHLRFNTVVDIPEAKSSKSFVNMARRSLVAILKKLDKRVYITHKKLIKQYV